MSFFRTRLASVALIACFGLAVGCGDNRPPTPSGAGGTGGQAGDGVGGSAGEGAVGGDTGLGGAGEAGEGGIGGGGAGSGGIGGTAGGTAGGGVAGGGAGSGGIAGGTAGGGAGGGGIGGGTAGHGGSGGAGASGSAGTAGTAGATGVAGGPGTAGATGSAGAGGSTGTGATAGSSAAGATGTAGAGGSSTTGTAGSGPAGNGGNAGSTGGAGAGGSGGSTLPPCYTVAFTAPGAGATLTIADDKTHSCVDGFQYDVTITTNAPNGTNVTLSGGLSPQTVQVSGGTATFSVDLAATAASTLQIQFPSTAACTDPSTSRSVTVSCSSTPPTCAVTQPVISATHPALNGVQAPTGDRTSSAGSDYQATLVVTTNAEDGQPVALQVTDKRTSAVSTISLIANGGAASGGVKLVPDDTYDVVATCTNRNGIATTSTTATFPVDTTAPDLTVSSPTDGQFFGPNQLANGAFQVCGQTTAMDASGLPSSLGTGAQNFCVKLGGSTQCTAASAVGSACVAVTCPGGAPFDLTVTLTDGAGNPTSKKISGVSCSSSLPVVEIVSPVSDAPSFADMAKRILSVTAPGGIHDLDGGAASAQANVVACSDASGTAALLAGHVGDGSLTQIATASTAAAVPSDNCPAGLGFAAHFTGATLPQSTEDATGALTAATRLEVTVTSSNHNLTGTSSPVDLWVDTVAPNISLASPGGLCGSFQQAPATLTQAVSFNADDGLVTLQIANGGSTTTYTNPSFTSGVATFSAVAFNQGSNEVTAGVADPAGNATAFATTPCTATIGPAPVVTFVTPNASNVLCPVGATANGCIADGDGNTAGWQGSIVVHVTVKGQPLTSGNITFTVGNTSLGVGALTAQGDATVTGITLSEGANKITATTEDVPGSGVGSGSLTVQVDLSPPNAPTGLTVNELDRRATSVTLSWKAPADISGSRVSGYEIRYANVPITSTNFDNASVTTAVTYSGTPSAPNADDSVAVTGLYIENNYYFAVEATDGAGNKSAIAATSSPFASHFNVTMLAGTAGLSNEQFGNQFDGSGDVNGDGRSDILVGALNGQRAYLFFGAAGNFSPSVPSVVFAGDATTSFFGFGVAAIGDVDADGREDIAVSDPGSTPARVFIYRGRSSWPLTLGPSNADYVITPGSTYNSSSFGVSIARLGDFNGDGFDDFAIGASAYKNGTNSVGRVVIILGNATFASITLPDTTNTITIDGDSTLTKPFFGTRVIGLGHFYSVGSGSTLVVSSPGATGSPNSTQGRLYAFHGQAGTGGSVPLASADSVVVGPSAGAFIGNVLANLGPMVNSSPSLGCGNPTDTTLGPGNSGTAFVFSGDSGTGPFANRVSFTRPGTARTGQVVIGGGISGRNSSYSLLGDDRPDLVLVPQTGSTIQIVDGNRVAGLAAGPNDPTSVATATISEPSGWLNTGPAEGGLLPDVNGDGYADFAIGNAVNPVPGKIAVYW